MNRIPRSRKCAACKAVFSPARSMQKVCGPACAAAWSKKLAEQKAARLKREEARETRAAKIKLKTRKQWKAEVQPIVNKVARLRDILAGRGCISCRARPNGRYGGSVDGGHFRSVGSAEHLRFYLWNIHLQCKKCNRDLGSNTIEYRKGLVERYGVEFVERIEAMQGTAKWSIEYLQRLKKVMNKMARRLERRIEERQGTEDFS